MRTKTASMMRVGSLLPLVAFIATVAGFSLLFFANNFTTGIELVLFGIVLLVFGLFYGVKGRR